MDSLEWMDLGETDGLKGDGWQSHMAPTWPKWSPRNLIWKCLAFYIQPKLEESLQKKIPRYMSTEEDLLYKKILSPSRNRSQLYATIKIPNPKSQIPHKPRYA